MSNWGQYWVKLNTPSIQPNAKEYNVKFTTKTRQSSCVTTRGVPPPPPTSKIFKNVCPIFCPKFCPFSVHFFVQNLVHFLSQILSNMFVQIYWGGTPGPPSWGVPPGAPPPQLGEYPKGAPPVGGYPWGRPPVGGYPRGHPPVGGYPQEHPPSWGVPQGVPPPVGGPPCEQTNWKHYLPIILRMQAVMSQHSCIFNNIECDLFWM